MRTRAPACARAQPCEPACPSCRTLACAHARACAHACDLARANAHSAHRHAHAQHARACTWTC
eukprot:8979902-Alexandrium_andersonii.AAC.1